MTHSICYPHFCLAFGPFPLFSLLNALRLLTLYIALLSAPHLPSPSHPTRLLLSTSTSRISASCIETMNRSITLFTVLLLLCSVVYGQVKTPYVNPRNPCHPNKRQYGDDSDCEVYRVPPQLCKFCKIKKSNYDTSGKFNQCSSIFNIEDPLCEEQLRLYAKWNRCDRERNMQVANYSANIIGLDYFAYSICEECCDCVSLDSRKDTYQSQRRDGKLFQVTERANCGTHAAADICLVWPNVKWVVNWWRQIPSKAEVEAMEPICPGLQKWRQDRKPNSGAGLTNEERFNVPAFARPFLNQFMKAVRCGRQTTWKECVDLELSQGRLTPDEPL